MVVINRAERCKVPTHLPFCACEGKLPARQTEVFAQRNEAVAGFPFAECLTHIEVNPFRETDWDLTVRRWLKICIHFVGCLADWSAVGEAETGSGGDQPVKE